MPQDHGANGTVASRQTYAGSDTKALIATLVDAVTGAAVSPSGNLPSGAASKSASSGNVAAAVATATLAGVASRTNYLSGFVLTGAGATAASVVLLTVTGLVGGTMTFAVAVPAGATLPLTPLIVNFPTPIPATAVNTAIVVSVPSLGAGNTNAAVTAFGYDV